MIKLIKIIILAVFNKLPDSPIQSALSDMDLSFLPTLNWFLPLDICASMFMAWLMCIVVYYIVVIIIKLVFNSTITSLLGKGITSLFG